jgi:hypothetical protein
VVLRFVFSELVFEWTKGIPSNGVGSTALDCICRWNDLDPSERLAFEYLLCFNLAPCRRSVVVIVVQELSRIYFGRPISLTFYISTYFKAFFSKVTQLITPVIGFVIHWI